MGDFRDCSYYKSEKHLESAKNASVKGNLKIQELKQKRIEEYYKNPKLCKECGEPIVYEKKNEKIFCNSSCSATFNNKKRVLTEETKQKISIKRINNALTKEELKRKCVNCGKEFIVNRSLKNVLSKAMCCSKECAHESMKINCSLAMKERVKNGEHIGWKTRNIISYPEKFFMKVLDNNGIKYFHNHVVKKRDLGLNDNGNYFLDFYVEELKLDIEIDGKQHKYKDREISDTLRDSLLNENGIIVYRIE